MQRGLITCLKSHIEWETVALVPLAGSEGLSYSFIAFILQVKKMRLRKFEGGSKSIPPGEKVRFILPCPWQ